MDKGITQFAAALSCPKPDYKTWTIIRMVNNGKMKLLGETV